MSARIEAVAWQYRDMRPDGVQVGVWRDIAEDLHGSYLFGGIISGVPWVDWEVRALYSQATVDTLRAQLEAAERAAQSTAATLMRTIARAEAAEADAARYRWLKSNHLQQWADTKTGAVSSCDFSFEAKGTWEMDAAIDAEIARTKEETK